MPEIPRRCAKGTDKSCRRWQPCPLHGTKGWENSKSPELPGNWKTLKKLVTKRDGLRCRMCGTPRDLQLDHRKPRSDGGSNDLSNLWLLCGQKGNDCHRKKERMYRKGEFR